MTSHLFSYKLNCKSGYNYSSCLLNSSFIQKSWKNHLYLKLQSITAVFFLASGNIISASLVAQMVKRLPTMWEIQVRSLGQEDPLEKEMATHSSIIAPLQLLLQEPLKNPVLLKHNKSFLLITDGGFKATDNVGFSFPLEALLLPCFLFPIFTLSLSGLLNFLRYLFSWQCC